MKKLIVILILHWGLVQLAHSQNPHVIFDHEQCKSDSPEGCFKSYNITLKPNEIFQIFIDNTYEDYFSYNLDKIKAPEAETTSDREGAQPKPVILTEVYDPQYAGYVVRISPKGDEDKGLGSAVLTINIEEKASWKDKWIYSVDGGYTLTDLTNPIFYLADKSITETITSANDQGQMVSQDVERSIMVIRENEEDRSKVQQSLASLINFGHRDLDILRGTVGLGIREDSDLSLFMGLGLEFGSVSLVGGRVFGPVQRLPNGAILDNVSIMDASNEVTDVNIINNTQNRQQGGWFFGFSLKLVTPSLDPFTKHFKDNELTESTETPDTNNEQLEKPNVDISFSPNASNLELDKTTLYTATCTPQNTFRDGAVTIVSSNFKITTKDDTNEPNQDEIVANLENNKVSFKIKSGGPNETTEITLKQIIDEFETESNPIRLQVKNDQ